MNLFDEWIGCIIRWASTGTLAAAIVGALAYFAFLPLEYAWQRMSIAAKIAWIKIARRLSEEQTLRQVEMFVQLEMERQRKTEDP